MTVVAAAEAVAAAPHPTFGVVTSRQEVLTYYNTARPVAGEKERFGVDVSEISQHELLFLRIPTPVDFPYGYFVRIHYPQSQTHGEHRGTFFKGPSFLLLQ